MLQDVVLTDPLLPTVAAGNQLGRVSQVEPPWIHYGPARQHPDDTSHDRATYRTTGRAAHMVSSPLISDSQPEASVRCICKTGYAYGRLIQW